MSARRMLGPGLMRRFRGAALFGVTLLLGVLLRLLAGLRFGLEVPAARRRDMGNSNGSDDRRTERPAG